MLFCPIHEHDKIVNIFKHLVCVSMLLDVVLPNTRAQYLKNFLLYMRKHVLGVPAVYGLTFTLKKTYYETPATAYENAYLTFSEMHFSGINYKGDLQHIVAV